MGWRKFLTGGNFFCTKLKCIFVTCKLDDDIRLSCHNQLNFLFHCDPHMPRDNTYNALFCRGLPRNLMAKFGLVGSAKL